MNKVFIRLVHSQPPVRPTPQQKNLINRIIRVDHIGELAANQIYAGQMLVLKGSPTGSLVKEMWDEEKSHLDTVERLAAKYEAPISIFTLPFSAAAFALGVGSALLGKEGAMACTTAVEEVVGEHYNGQIKELLADDPEAHKPLIEKLAEMRDQELHHLQIGVENNAQNLPAYNAFKSVVQFGCKTAIEIAKRI